MKKSIHKLMSLALIFSGLGYACQQDECVVEKQQSIWEKVETEAETRNGDGTLYCNVTTTAAGQVDSLITALATEGNYPKDGITHLTISGPINNNDIKTMCNFQYLDSLILTDAKIEKIAQDAFEYFKSPAHIMLPNSLKTIERYAFDLSYQNYYSIKSVYIPDSVTSIGEYAFFDCKNLESVRLPQNITVLPEGIFRFCENLKELIVPKYVKEIKENALDGCSSLEKVEIPNNVTEMGRYVFNNCANLDSIKWPNYLRYIPDHCFSGCSNLKFEIPNYVTKIGAHAFSNCKNITEYKIPAKVESIGEYAFEGTGVTTLTLTDKTLVSKGLFNGSAITNLTISEGVTSLPDYIFQNCDNLTTLKFPSSLKTIGSYAFNACDGFTTIEFNENLETIGACAFRELSKLTTVSIPAVTVQNGAFRDCKKLKSVTFKSTVKTIGEYAFDECEAIDKIVWNEGLETIGYSAFYQIPELTEFTAPSTLKTIGSYAFYNCEKLGVVVLNEGLKELGANAFAITPIKTIVVPSTLEKCGDCPFQKCNDLTSVFWKPNISAPNLSAYYDDQINTLLYLSHGQSHVDNPNQIVNGKSQSPILLRSGGNFHCPESFVSDMRYERVFNRRYDYASDQVSTEDSYDRNYSFQNKIGEASCWQTIVLPFEVTSIKCGDKELVPFGAEKEGAYPFWLRELTPNGFVKATKIEANKPYIIAMPNNAAYADEYNIRGKVVFSAENVTIPVTEELKEVQGASFNFYPTYTYLGSHAEKLVLNRINEYDDWVTGKHFYYGSVFIPSTYDCPTFHAYVNSPAGGRSVVPIETSLSSRKAHKLGPIPQENDM